jgi:hypothetical protein
MDLSREHFLHVEQRLRPDFNSEPTADLQAVFAPQPAAVRRTKRPA